MTSVNNSAAESLKMSVPIENSLDQDNVADEQGMQNVPRISARATLHSEQEQTNPTQTHSRFPSDLLDPSEIAKLRNTQQKSDDQMASAPKVLPKNTGLTKTQTYDETQPSSAY